MNRKIFEKNLDGSQGYLYFSYDELNLDKGKMYLTGAKFPQFYNTEGWIKLGTPKQYRAYAENRFKPWLLDQPQNLKIGLFFVPLFEKPFVCYLDEERNFRLVDCGYFDRAKTVFQAVDFGKDFDAIGLIENVMGEDWDIIEI